MTDVAKADSVTKRRLAVAINLPSRVAGIFYAAYGAVALIRMIAFSPPAPSPRLNVAACVILGGFLGFGLLLSLFVETLSFDLMAQTYQYRKGLWPFLKTVSGSIGDLKAIEVERVERVHGDGEASQAAPSVVLSVRIAWADGRPTIELFSGHEDSWFGNNRARLLRKAAHLAEAVGIPVDDRS